MSVVDISYNNKQNMAQLSWLLVLIVFESMTQESQQFMYPANVAIKPRDAEVFIGDTLKVQCKSNINNADVHFKVEVNGSSWNVAVQNSSEENLVFANIVITEDYVGKATIQCMQTSTNTLLQSTNLYSEWPVKEVNNFKGVYIFNEFIKLTWTLEQYRYPNKINVTVDYNSNSPPNNSGNRCTSSTRETCIIGNYKQQDILFIRITVESHIKRPGPEFVTPLYNTTATSLFNFTPFENMKVGAPINFSIVAENNTCLTLRWEDPYYFSLALTTKIFYKIDVREDGQTEFYTAVDEAERPVSKEREPVLLCHLTPFTTYKLRLEVKAKEMNPWSDPAETEGRTAEDVPLNGPPLTDTSYSTKDCKDNRREVTVYWNDPTTSSLRGLLTNFEAVNGNKTEPLRKGSNFYTSGLDCHTSSSISIYSVTKAGRGLRPSVVHIPSVPEKDSALYGPNDDFTVVIEEQVSLLESKTEKNITVRWNAFEMMAEWTLMFYMGQSASIRNDITFLFDYAVKETKADNLELHIKYLPMSLNMFGYALKHRTGHTRGIKWIDCVYQADKAPGKPEGLRVIPVEESNSLYITWSTPRCDRNDKVFIDKFHLKICKQISDECKDVPVKSKPGLESNQHIEKDLEANQQYDVYLNSESLNGSMGEWSGPATAFLKRQSSSDSSMIAILLSVFVFIILLGTVISWLFRRFWKSKKQFDKLIKNHTAIFPAVSDFSRQSSKESGFGSSGSDTHIGNNVNMPLPEIPVALSTPGQTQPKNSFDSTTAVVTRTNVNTENVPFVAGQRSEGVNYEPSLNSEITHGTSQVDRFHDPSPARINDISGSDNTYFQCAGENFASDVSDEKRTVTRGISYLDEGHSSPQQVISVPVFNVQAIQDSSPEMSDQQGFLVLKNNNEIGEVPEWKGSFRTAGDPSHHSEDDANQDTDSNLYKQGLNTSGSPYVRENQVGMENLLISGNKNQEFSTSNFLGPKDSEFVRMPPYVSQAPRLEHIGQDSIPDPRNCQGQGIKEPETPSSDLNSCADYIISDYIRSTIKNDHQYCEDHRKQDASVHGRVVSNNKDALGASPLMSPTDSSEHLSHCGTDCYKVKEIKQDYGDEVLTSVNSEYLRHDHSFGELPKQQNQVRRDPEKCSNSYTTETQRTSVVSENSKASRNDQKDAEGNVKSLLSVRYVPRFELSAGNDGISNERDTASETLQNESGKSNNKCKALSINEEDTEGTSYRKSSFSDGYVSSGEPSARNVESQMNETQPQKTCRMSQDRVDESYSFNNDKP